MYKRCKPTWLALLVCLLLAANVARAYGTGSRADQPALPAVNPSGPATVDPELPIQALVTQVISSTVKQYTGDLSGEWPVIIGGEAYTIATRYTYSGAAIDKATQFAGEHLESLGLDVEYHPWTSSGASGRNVIGELPGAICPEEIYIISAHLDSRARLHATSLTLAPGADDNASGSAAVLLAADIFSQLEPDATLRFALWTGEEQGLLGSKIYAQRAKASGEQIVGVLNLDMIGWNTPGSQPDLDLHANSSVDGSLALAQLFAGVIEAYKLNLIPEIIASGTGASDHASFWNQGYAAILAIEDYYQAPNNDFNPNYHSTSDLLATLDLAYFTEMVKAAVATLAHMDACTANSGTVDGHVTTAVENAPIGGAQVFLADPSGLQRITATDSTGYYTSTLPAGSYTITVSADKFFPATIDHVQLLTGTVTTQNFSLDPWPEILLPIIMLNQAVTAPLGSEGPAPADYRPQADHMYNLPFD